MDLTVYRDESGFDALKTDWNDLLKRSRFDTVFLTWEWQNTWWRSLGRGDLWLLAWRDGEELIGIVPFFLETGDDGKRDFRIVGCIEVSDYVDLIIAQGHEDQVYAGLLDWLESADAPAWDRLDLCNLPQDSLTHRLLPELAAGRGLNSVTFLEDVCPIIELPDSWEGYLQDRLSKKQRHEVRRKLRKLEQAAAIHWYVVGQEADLDREMDDFIELHRLSTTEKHSFMTPDMQAFFRQVTRVLHKAGWLHLAFLEIDGEKAAAMLSFAYGGRLLVYNSGYDPQKYSEFSPGIVLTSYTIQSAIERGYRIFDFLQGDEVYKYRFGASDTAVYRAQIGR